MADWIFFSPSLRFASAGDLLRAIPSRRIWRLERTFVEDGEDTREMVRAAEQLLDLDVTLRMQNDPSAATRLCVAEPTAAQRKLFGALARNEFRAAELRIVAEVTLSEAAIEAGHLDIADDVLCGLEQIYPGGVAHCPESGEVVTTAEIVRIMDADEQGCSHLDVRLQCDGPQRAYVARQLTELPPPFGRYLRVDGDTLLLRARFPTHLSRADVDAVCAVALEMAAFARAGHVRFREHGVWRHAVEGIGACVAVPPADQSEGVFGKISRLLRQSK